MPLLPIIEVPDPLLRKVSSPVEAFDDSLRTLVADMFETMYAAPGIGLAAVQVGAPLRLLIIDLAEPVEENGPPVRDPRVFINPEIVAASEEMSVYNEGCLSIPEQYGEVERPARVEARWRDGEGAAREGAFEGLMATCLQHEIDHLNGVLFFDHLSKLKRDMLLKKLQKWRRDNPKAA